MKQSFIQYLTEQTLRKMDPEMDEYYGDTEDQRMDVKDAPYGVIITDVIDDEGKPYYSDTMIAINIPTYSQAQKIADDVEEAVHDGSFGHRAHGSSYVADDIIRVEVIPMKDVDKHTMQYSEPMFDGSK